MTRLPKRSRWITAWAVVAAVAAIAVPTAAWATGDLPSLATPMHAAGGQGSDGASSEHGQPNPMHEFALERIGPKLQVGPIDMSINKAVIYLWMSAIICCGWTLWMGRRMQLKPNRRQTFTEAIYEFAFDTIAKQTLGPKVFSRYMPYVASLFMFLWIVNLLSFLPLPFGENHDLVLYAATSNINVTLALTIVTFLASHYEGIRHNGAIKYFGSWAPPGSIFLKIFIWPLHALSELLRLVSLSVRLFANMLAGHLLILMMLSLIAIIGSALIAIGTVPVALFFYLFEFCLVASLQAFIFAMLSGIYIGFAAEPAH